MKVLLAGGVAGRDGVEVAVRHVAGRVAPGVRALPEDRPSARRRREAAARGGSGARCRR